MTIHLYIKEHVETGLLYFGKTTKDPYTYYGSGKYWLRHIKKHGKKCVKTVWASSFEDEEACVEFATFFSEFYNIVDSDIWANLINENGLDGAPPGVKNSGPSGIKNGMFGKTGQLNPFFGKQHTLKQKEMWSKSRIGKLNPNYDGKSFTEETIIKLKRPKSNKKNYKGSPNQINCIDKLGNGVRISCDMYNNQKLLQIPMSDWEYVNTNSKVAKCRRTLLDKVEGK